MKPNKNIFEHIYTRDRQIITQHAWYYANSKGISKLLKMPLPYKYPSIYYVKDGAVEIWENRFAQKWLREVILKRNLKDKKFLPKIIRFFKFKIKNYFEPIWKSKRLKNNKELKRFIKEFKNYCPHFLYIWISMLDKRTPEFLHPYLNRWRKSDVFFENSSNVIINSLKANYPRIESYHNYILENEVIKPPHLKVLAGRKKNFVTIPGFYEKVESLQDFARRNPEFRFKKEFLTKNILNKIKGQTAQKGRVRGCVKILRNLEQVKKVRKGNIIVSPMTIPEFLPAMKKAAAFITDEGGITCHAAIVARELKKPCIIGTKIATKVLKDGDLVEVDAERGVVKILKRKK